MSSDGLHISGCKGADDKSLWDHFLGMIYFDRSDIELYAHGRTPTSMTLLRD